VNAFGPETAKWTKKALEFRASKSAANPDGSDENQRVIYVKYELTNTAVESWDELKPIIDQFMESEPAQMPLSKLNLAYDITHSGEKLIVQVAVMPSAGERAFASVHPALTEALAEVDNHIEVKFKLATSPGEIMKGEKAISECLLGGFSYNVDLTYLKNIKKMSMVLPEREQQNLLMGAPVFKLGVKANVSLTFEDAEDIKEHPMIGDKFDMKFDDVFGMIGADKATFADYEVDLSGLDEAKVKEADPQVQLMFAGLKASNIVSKLIRGLQEADGTFHMKTDAVISGVCHFDVSAKTNGVGELYQMGFNAASMGPRESIKEMLSSMM